MTNYNTRARDMFIVIASSFATFHHVDQKLHLVELDASLATLFFEIRGRVLQVQDLYVLAPTEEFLIRSRLSYHSDTKHGIAKVDNALQDAVHVQDLHNVVLSLPQGFVLFGRPFSLFGKKRSNNCGSVCTRRLRVLPSPSCIVI
jgi:hypothetical protein